MVEDFNVREIATALGCSDLDRRWIDACIRTSLFWNQSGSHWIWLTYFPSKEVCRGLRALTIDSQAAPGFVHLGTWILQVDGVVDEGAVESYRFILDFHAIHDRGPWSRCSAAATCHLEELGPTVFRRAIHNNRIEVQMVTAD